MRPSRSLLPIRVSFHACPLICGAAMAVAAPVQAAQASPELFFDIPAQSLATALDRFARQAGVQILYPYRLAAPRHSAGVRGRMTAREALYRLLRNSGLEIARLSERVVVMSNRPGKVIEIIDVDLTLEDRMSYSNAMHEYEVHLENLIESQIDDEKQELMYS